MRSFGTPKKYDKAAAYARIARYCAYQERSPKEVRDKLRSYGLTSQEVEELTDRMIDENYLHEARFAEAYAGGKFRLKKWGRVRIRMGLRQHGIADSLIEESLAALDAVDYRATLQQLAQKKAASLTAEEPLLRKQKLVAYLLNKGYEPDLVWPLVETTLS
ncbi:regulatory protein [Catalinimonas alkaloidigena]|uniref:Regulatory protein RecX n=1 Tax=Catalinimonas alkaloidigena TaxID=1075417 RepID=A0A1G9DZ55_9BACT|nr:regulatory protein RecX [Catalinimonas alkaloidigena]SDK69100.1 regulatory protein [Catalinimonas alkaloidigena]